METSGLLDIADDVYLFCLHHIFIPRVNSSLTAFKNAWNSHPLTSEGCLSPNQLWISGLSRIDTDANVQTQLYGVDWSVPIPIDNEDEVESVHIHPVTTILSDEQLSELAALVYNFLNISSASFPLPCLVSSSLPIQSKNSYINNVQSLSISP